MKAQNAFLQALAVSKGYTDETVAGGGAIKGKNCTVDSITDIDGGHRVTFKWTLDNGTVKTGSMDVMDGAKGEDGATGAQGPKGDKGDKGDKGADGTVSFDELTPEQQASLKGDKGDKGDTGAQGPAGQDGAPGVGVPSGGTTGQVLKKSSGTDYDAEWADESGGSGGGHTIEDSEGTDLTQRDTLQFGDGFSAEDDSQNEKTVISPNLMTSGDMDDVVSPLPSVHARLTNYSTSEQIVGTWINGDTVYQKTVVETGTSSASSGFDYITINLVTGVDTLIEANGMIYDGNGRVYSTGGTMGDSLGTVSVMGRFGITDHTVNYTALNNMALTGNNDLTIKATIRYTKTSS